MKVTQAESWRQSLPLKRPYTITSRTVDAVELFFVRLETEAGVVGVGSASPATGVTGETPEACEAALGVASLGWLVGWDARHRAAAARRLAAELPAAPAARAAVDMALWDLLGRRFGVPVVDLLGRCHRGLETSVTIGIMGTEEALEEAEEYVGRGFRHLKVKIGRDPEADAERLERLREKVGPEVRLRVDANQGYDVEATLALGELARRLDLELIEQPLPAAAVEEMRRLPDALRRRIAADESLHGEADALELTREPAACGIFNLKLMKSGGITPALGIARLAELTGREMMWGCNDESALSITAALHAAYASPATRYLDLDGSFDLARDPARGGFHLEGGRLILGDEPGLGIRLER